MPLLPDETRELVEISQAQRRRTRHRDRVRQADESLANKVAQLAAHYTWVPAGAVWSLAKDGQTPGAPVADEIGRRAAVHGSRTAFAKPGQQVSSLAFTERDALGPIEERPWYLAAQERLARLALEHPGIDRNVLWKLARDGVEPGPESQRAVQGAGIEVPAARTIGEPELRQAGIDTVGEPTADPSRFARENPADVTPQWIDAQGVVHQDVVPDPGSILQPALRTAGMALNYPAQELQGLFRGAVEDVRLIASGDIDKVRWGEYNSESDVGIAFGKLTRGDEVDVGSGYFVDPRSEVAQERMRLERQHGTIGGHSITVGRFAASLFLDPNTKPFNLASGLLDAGVALRADPSAMVLSKVGAYRGLRNVVDPKKAGAWLAGPGRKVIDALAEETSWDKTWRMLGKKAPADVVSSLTDARTSDEVTDILRGTLGPQLREFPTIRPAGRAYTSKGYVRLTQLMPRAKIDLLDLDDAVEQVDRVARNAKLHADRVAVYTERMGRSAGSRHAQWDVVTDLMDEIGAKVAGVPGGTSKLGQRLTKMYRDSTEATRLYFTRETGRNALHPGTVVDAHGNAEAKPHLFDEVVGRFIELPDQRELRRFLSPMKPVAQLYEAHPTFELPEAFVHFLVNRVWKDSVLMRLAYPVRVIGEEQFRMAAAGMDSMFHHPLSYLAYVTGRKGGADVFDTAWDDILQFHSALVAGSAGFRDPAGFHRARHWTTVRPNEEHYVASWADEVSQLHADPIGRRVAEADDIDDVKEWFWRGDGARLRNQLTLSEDFDALVTKAGADNYIDSIVERIHIKTAGDSRLIEALKTGRLNGAKISHDGATMSRDFVKQLQTIYDEGVNAGIVKGQLRVQARGKGDWVERYDEVMESMFGFLMGRRTNELSRSVVFKQRYWQRMEELSPYLKPSARTRAADQARGLKLDDRAKGIAKATDDGTLELSHADELAKGFALDETKHLLYDLAERGQFFDVMRLIFPFGEAWKEMVTRWHEILTTRPVAARRLQQGIEEGKESGFFYNDPQTGDLVFNWPGSQWLNERLVGVPFPLTSRVQGLSLMTEVLPGVGPVVQVPASYLIPDTPDWDWLTKEVLPFGRVRNPTELREWAPAWAQKFLTALAPTPEMQRLYANSVKDVSNYLLSTGEYKIHGAAAEEEMDRLMRDSKQKAKWLTMIRGAGQTFLPAAPSPQEMVEDPDGRLRMLSEIKSDFFQNIVPDAGGDMDVAAQAFLEKYGPDLASVMQPYSYSVIFGIPTTKAGLDFRRENPDLVKRYPFTWGYFAPTGGDLDMEAYRRAFEADEKTNLTPEQWLGLHNHRIASHIYRAQQDKIGARPTDAQRAWLAELKDSLKDEYPGFERPLALPQRAETDQLVDELARAVEDDTLSRTDAGQALETYLRAREQAEDSARSRGYQRSSFATANGMRDVRDWLREIGGALVEEHPGFQPLWEGVLSRELDDDTEEAAA